MVCHGSDSLPIRPAAEVCSVRGALLKADAGYPERRQEHLFYWVFQMGSDGSIGEGIGGMRNSAQGVMERLRQRENGCLRAERIDGAECVHARAVSMRTT